jgi:hypothetical protein
MDCLAFRREIQMRSCATGGAGMSKTGRVQLNQTGGADIEQNSRNRPLWRSLNARKAM